jgi:hypothetical protein
METIRHIYEVDRAEINYIRWTVESYDGMAVVRTLDPHKGWIELLISPGCETLVADLLRSLSVEEGLRLARVDKTVLDG